MKRIIERLSVLALIVVMMLSAVSVSGFAEDGTPKKAKRTILLYTIGSDLETSAGMATALSWSRYTSSVLTTAARKSIQAAWSKS